MLVLVAGVELGLSRLRDWVLHTSHWSWIRDGRAASSGEVRASRVLLFGDSMIKNGLLPHTMEGRGGHPAYNLALLGGHAPASYFLLRRALEAGARPATVVVDYERARLTLDPNDPEDRYPWASFLSPAEAADLARTCGDPAFAGRLLVGELLPSVRMRHDLRTAIRVNLRGLSVMSHWGQLVYRRNLRRNRGALVHDRKASPTDLPLNPNAATEFARWTPKGANLRYVARFLDLAESRGVRVVWLMPPVSPGLQRNYDQGAAEAEWAAFARRQLARYPGLTIVDGRRSGYPLAVFGDPVHLDRRGAAVLSDALAGLLGPDATVPPGWHALPAFPGVRDDPRTEDLDQSGAAVAAAGAGLRR
jgi:hypothetical protein